VGFFSFHDISPSSSSSSPSHLYHLQQHRPPIDHTNPQSISTSPDHTCLYPYRHHVHILHPQSKLLSNTLCFASFPSSCYPFFWHHNHLPTSDAPPLLNPSGLSFGGTPNGSDVYLDAGRLKRADSTLLLQNGGSGTNDWHTFLASKEMLCRNSHRFIEIEINNNHLNAVHAIFAHCPL
jgi:hypothetical protein